MYLTTLLLVLTQALVTPSFASPVAPGTQANNGNDLAVHDASTWKRDAQIADMAVVQEILDKTGYNYLDSNQVMTPEDLAMLSADDAQLLSTELNKYLKNHDQADAVIPEFTNEEFTAAKAVLVQRSLASKRPLTGGQQLTIFTTILNSVLSVIDFFLPCTKADTRKHCSKKGKHKNKHKNKDKHKHKHDDKPSGYE